MKVDKKCITLFRIRWLLPLLLVLSGFIFCFFIEDKNYRIAALIPTGCLLLIMFVLTIVWPILEYKAISYTIDEEMFVIKKGVIYRNEIIVPIIQVQDINTFQGPLMIILNLKGIIISTAGSNERITGLNAEIAQKAIYDIEKSIYYKVKNEIQ